MLCAAELGVAKGSFSEEILRTHLNIILFSIDRWAGDRGHGEEEMNRVKQLLSSHNIRSHIWQLDFKEAAARFEPGTLDWVFIDGYAHNGQDGIETLRMWYPKVRPGGIFSGHDYDTERWPETTTVVDAFAREVGAEVNVTDEYGGAVWDNFPSWFWRKP